MDVFKDVKIILQNSIFFKASPIIVDKTELILLFSAHLF